MPGQLAVLVPSRGRPQNVLRLAKAWAKTLTGNAWLEVITDSDDESFTDEVVIRIIEAGAAGLSGGRRIRLGPTLNREAAIWTELCPYIGFMGDDHLPQTPGWDERVVEALDEMKSGIVYGNDLFQGPNLPTAVFMTSDIVKTLGYMVPPGLTHMYLDNAWLEWGQGMGKIKYLPDVIIEHLHPQAGGKSEVDATYEDVWPYMAIDEPIWQEYKTTRLAADVEKLKGLIR